MSSLFGNDKCGAEFSDDGVYRYTLTREWSDGPCVCWIMFNPSTADAFKNDATVRRCIEFSHRWGYGRLIVINLYAVRSTDPKAVTRMGPSAVGPLNDYWIFESIGQSQALMCAWGCAQHVATIDDRVRSVRKCIRTIPWDKYPIECLGYRKDGHPRHPLMLAYNTPRQPFVWGDA